MKISNFIFTISLLVITSFSNAQQIAIIPEPFQMKVGNGSYTLPKVVVMSAPASANEISELISKKMNLKNFINENKSFSLNIFEKLYKKNLKYYGKF